MKKGARSRLSPNNLSEEMAHNRHSSSSEPIVRTTGRIKKPKAVFDPSDNYLSRAQRSLITGNAFSSNHNGPSSLERRASYAKASTVSPVGPSENKDACVVCKKKESKRPQFASKNPLITCQGCKRKIHKLCLRVDFEDFESLQRNYKCDQCSACRICNDTFTNAEDDILICSKCTKSFHMDCFPSKIIKSDNLRNWKCNKCQVYNQINNSTALPVKKIREIIGGGEPTVVTNPEKSTNPVIEKSSEENSKSEREPASPLIQKRSSIEQHSIDDIKSEETVDDKMSPSPEKRQKAANHSPDSITTETVSLNTSSSICYTPNENFDDIPDVKEWSVDQVYEFFLKYFPKEAFVLKNEEIDGRSLLLLKRSDVVKKLPIKLGPSLRIYSLILKIQAQLNDPTLGWNCGL